MGLTLAALAWPVTYFAGAGGMTAPKGLALAVTCLYMLTYGLPTLAILMLARVLAIQGGTLGLIEAARFGLYFAGLLLFALVLLDASSPRGVSYGGLVTLGWPTFAAWCGYTIGLSVAPRWARW